jgi:two-component system response regulator DevR
MACRVVVVCSERIVRMGLMSLLEEWADEYVARQAATIREATTDRAWRPDVVVLVPGATLAEDVRACRQAWPRARVLAVPRHDGLATVRDAFNAGADGVAAWGGDDPSAFLDPLRRVRVEDRVLSRQAVDRVLTAFLKSGGCDAQVRLTERQREVLALIRDGASNKEIARRLYLSQGTVKKLISEIFQALGARNRAEAVAAILGVVEILEPARGHPDGERRGT